jgi:hypothetical protein
VSTLAVVSTSIVAVATAGATAAVAGIVGARAGRDKANREHAAQFDVFLRADRARTYPQVWAVAARLLPSAIQSLDLQQLASYRRELDDFYLSEGGLYLSRRSVEALIVLWDYADELLVAGTPLGDEGRKELADRSHVLRRCLTRDLGGRSKSPVVQDD